MNVSLGPPIASSNDSVARLRIRNAIRHSRRKRWSNFWDTTTVNTFPNQSQIPVLELRNSSVCFGPLAFTILARTEENKMLTKRERERAQEMQLHDAKVFIERLGISRSYEEVRCRSCFAPCVINALGQSRNCSSLPDAADLMMIHEVVYFGRYFNLAWCPCEIMWRCITFESTTLLIYIYIFTH